MRQYENMFILKLFWGEKTFLLCSLLCYATSFKKKIVLYNPEVLFNLPFYISMLKLFRFNYAN